MESSRKFFGSVRQEGLIDRKQKMLCFQITILIYFRPWIIDKMFFIRMCRKIDGEWEWNKKKEKGKVRNRENRRTCYVFDQYYRNSITKNSIQRGNTFSSFFLLVASKYFHPCVQSLVSSTRFVRNRRSRFMDKFLIAAIDVQALQRHTSNTKPLARF